MGRLSATKAQLKALGYPSVGIQLKSGGKVFGKVDRFTQHTIYVRDKHGDIIDVPRKIVTRAFLCIDGGKENEPTAGVSKKNKSYR